MSWKYLHKMFYVWGTDQLYSYGLICKMKIFFEWQELPHTNIIIKSIKMKNKPDKPQDEFWNLWRLITQNTGIKLFA